MAHVSVPKDSMRVKSKVLLNLTKWQLLCFGAALLVGVSLFFILRNSTCTNTAALVMILAMLPGFLLALYEKYGQSLEVIAGQMIQALFIRQKSGLIRPTTFTPP